MGRETRVERVRRRRRNGGRAGSGVMVSSSCGRMSGQCREVEIRPGLGIGNIAGARESRLDMLAQRRVADGVAPVDQPLLQLVVEPLEPRRRLRRARVSARAGRAARPATRSRRCRCGCPNKRLCVLVAPVSNESITWRLRRRAPGCRSGRAPDRVPRPVALGLLLGLHLAAAVADQHRLVALPDRLQAEVVVDAAVGEDRPCVVNGSRAGPCPSLA